MVFPPNNSRKLSFNLREYGQVVSDNSPEEFFDKITPDFFPSNSDERLTIGLNLSLNEYVKLSSAIDIGRDIAYPDESVDLWQIWTRALLEIAAPLTAESSDCFDYGLTAPFVKYYPYNPYQDPTPIPNGYLSAPFFIVDGLWDLLPYYGTGDLIVLPTSLSLIDFTIFGQPITVSIDVQGSGQVELELLKVPQGGQAIITYDHVPTALDVIAGSFLPDTQVINLDLDLSQIPPEDTENIMLEFNIEQEPDEKRTIYISFFPVVDLDAIPLKFGGGIRSIQLCGFESEGVVSGITDIRINGCNIEYFLNSEWVVVGAIDETCFPTIAQNSADIDALEVDATAQAALITQNIADIDALEVDATAQAALITQNIADIDDHETRITSLEGASGGSSEFDVKTITTRRKVLTQTNLGEQSEITIDMPLLWKRVFIEIEAFSTHSANEFLYMFANEDETQANYRCIALGGSIVNLARIAQIGNDDQVVYGESGVIEIMFDYPSLNGSRKVAASSYGTNGDTPAVPLRQGLTWVWENTDPIDTLTFKPVVGDFAALGVVRVYVEEETDVLIPIEEAPETDWTVEFDFSGEDLDELFTGDATDAWVGSGYWQDTGGTLNLYLTGIEPFNLISADIQYFIEDENSAEFGEVRIFTNLDSYSADAVVLDAIDTKSITINENGVTELQFRIRAMLTEPTPDNRCYKITLHGSGTLPSEFEPYEI